MIINLVTEIECQECLYRIPKLNHLSGSAETMAQKHADETLHTVAVTTTNTDSRNSSTTYFRAKADNMWSDTMNLGLHATNREIKVLRFIGTHDDNEVSYDDMYQNIDFGKGRPSIDLDIVLQDLVDTKILTDEEFETFELTDLGKRVLRKIWTWDRQNV